MNAFHHAHEAVEYALGERPGPAHVALLRETAGLSHQCFGFGGRAPVSVRGGWRSAWQGAGFRQFSSRSIPTDEDEEEGVSQFQVGPVQTSTDKLKHPIRQCCAHCDANGAVATAARLATIVGTLVQDR